MRVAAAVLEDLYGQLKRGRSSAATRWTRACAWRWTGRTPARVRGRRGRRSAPSASSSCAALAEPGGLYARARPPRSGVRAGPGRHRQDLSRRRHGAWPCSSSAGSSGSSCRGRRSRRASGWASCRAICKDKVDPYMRPLYDALQDMLPEGKLQQRIETGQIEIAPLAYMRGRTLSNAYRHPRRGAEHHAVADEDVPHPPGRELPYGGHRRSDAERSAAGHAVRAWATRSRKLRALEAVSVVQFDNEGRGPASAGRRDHRGLRDGGAADRPTDGGSAPAPGRGSRPFRNDGQRQ